MLTLPLVRVDMLYMVVQVPPVVKHLPTVALEPGGHFRLHASPRQGIFRQETDDDSQHAGYTLNHCSPCRQASDVLYHRCQNHQHAEPDGLGSCDFSPIYHSNLLNLWVNRTFLDEAFHQL